MKRGFSCLCSWKQNYYKSLYQNHNFAQSPFQLYTKIFLQGYLPSNCLSNLGVASPLLLIFVANSNYLKTVMRFSSHFPWSIFVLFTSLNLHIIYNWQADSHCNILLPNNYPLLSDNLSLIWVGKSFIPWSPGQRLSSLQWVTSSRQQVYPMEVSRVLTSTFFHTFYNILCQISRYPGRRNKIQFDYYFK